MLTFLNNIYSFYKAIKRRERLAKENIKPAKQLWLMSTGESLNDESLERVGIRSSSLGYGSGPEKFFLYNK